MRGRSGIIALAAIIAACGREASPTPQTACERPIGCVHADRVGETCLCLEWQVVSVEPVPVRFVVVGVVYAPLGNLSVLTYGYTGTGLLAPAPPASSDLGARWRSVIRARDGSEIVATLGPGDLGQGVWGPLVAATGTSAALVQPSNVALAFRSAVDVATPVSDEFFIWINPAAAVATNYAGEKSISWSWTTECSYPGGCFGPTVFPFTAGELDGTVIPMNPYVLAMLEGFDAADRAAILAHDPFFDPPGRDPTTLTADPRFHRLGTATVIPGVAAAMPPIAWLPCAGTLTDENFLGLHSVDSPFGAGETMVLQHAFLSTGSCTAQNPGLHLESSTPGCSIVADVLVDTMFGTLLTLPESIGATCTSP